MPCRCDGYPSTTDVQKQEINDLTEMLCTLCGRLEDAGVLDTFANEHTQAWFQNHQEMDRLRMERERLAKKREADRQRGLKKLTAAERKALGLK